MRFIKTLLLSTFLLTPVILRADLPAAHGPVNDFAGVLDGNEQDSLTALLQELEQKAGAQVAVAVVKSLEGMDVETYATALYKKWGIGDQKTNRGVLILLAVDDRKARIEPGYGLEGILPDGLCGSILDRYMIPSFKEQRFSEGILRGAVAVASVIAQDANVTLTGRIPLRSGTPRQPLAVKIALLLLLLLAIPVFIRHPFLLLLLLNQGRGGSGGGFGGGDWGGFGGGSSGGGGASRGW